MLLQVRQVTCVQDWLYGMDGIAEQQSPDCIFSASIKNGNLSNASTNEVGVRHNPGTYFPQILRCALEGMTREAGNKHSVPVSQWFYLPVSRQGCDMRLKQGEG